LRKKRIQRTRTKRRTRRRRRRKRRRRRGRRKREREERKGGREGESEGRTRRRRRRSRRRRRKPFLLQALYDHRSDDGNDWLSYLRSDPGMMLVLLLRNRAAALVAQAATDRPSRGEKREKKTYRAPWETTPAHCLDLDSGRHVCVRVRYRVHARLRACACACVRARAVPLRSSEFEGQRKQAATESSAATREPSLLPKNSRQPSRSGFTKHTTNSRDTKALRLRHFVNELIGRGQLLLEAAVAAICKRTNRLAPGLPGRARSSRSRLLERSRLHVRLEALGPEHRLEELLKLLRGRRSSRSLGLIVSTVFQ
jgi:hypothetical protein